jgi:hypothetical protein
MNSTCPVVTKAMMGCASQTFSAGEAFVEHGDQPTGQVRNASVTAPSVFSVTQIAPSGVPRRAETDPPSCGDLDPDPHTNTDSDSD